MPCAASGSFDFAMDNDTSLIMVQWAIAVFVFGLPVLAYWIYRVHVMGVFFIPIRHILQLFGISAFSIIVSFSLVKAESRLLTIVLILILSSSLGALELFLRKVSKKFNKETGNYRVSQGKNGVQVKYSEAREASGDYPRVYMTESYFNSIQYGTMYERETSPKIREPGEHYDQAFDYLAPGISVTKGIRGTSDQPKLWSRKLLFFGGSTTFGGREVPDDLTFPSFVQRRVNLESGGEVKVINHGQGGATVIDRVNWLINETPTNPGDIVVFYFGANDCGWRVRGMTFHGYQINFQSPLLVVLNRYKDKGFEVLRWLHGELAHSHNKRYADRAFKKTVSELQRAKKWAELQELRFLVVLQPHLYLSKVVSEYENSLVGRFSFFMRDQLRIAYPKYEEFVKKCGYGVSFTTIFDDLEHSVYLDWCHVNARGNEIISDHLYREIKSRHWV